MKSIIWLNNACLGVTSKVQIGYGTERSAGEDTSPWPDFWKGWPGAQASTMFPSWTKGHSTVTLMSPLSVREPLPLWTSNFCSENIRQIPNWQSQAILEGLAASEFRWSCTKSKTMTRAWRSGSVHIPFKDSFIQHECYQVSTVGTAHPASVWMRAGPLTWAGLTGDGELLYQRCRGVAVVVGIQNPPVWALSKENPVKKQNEGLELLKECFGPTPQLQESVAQGEDP